MRNKFNRTTYATVTIVNNNIFYIWKLLRVNFKYVTTLTQNKLSVFYLAFNSLHMSFTSKLYFTLWIYIIFVNQKNIKWIPWVSSFAEGSEKFVYLKVSRANSANRFEKAFPDKLRDEKNQLNQVNPMNCGKWWRLKESEMKKQSGNICI